MTAGTSLQPLGATLVLVSYDSFPAEDGGVYPDTPAYVEVSGFSVKGVEFDQGILLGSIVAEWERAIARELRGEAVESRANARIQAVIDRRAEFA